MIKLSNLTYRKIRYLMHAIFWVCFTLAGSFVLSYQENYPYRFFLINFLVNLPVYMLYTYFCVYILIISLLLYKKYFQCLFILVTSTFAFSMIKLAVTKFIFYEFFIPSFLHPENWINVELVIINVLWLLVPTVIFAAIKFYMDWVNSLAEKTEIEKRKLESELQLLKAQLNPHFLFNTLNNLYVLALQKSDKTPEVIAKISELFHFILYECNEFKVPLHKELKLIQNFIELEQIRYSDRLNLEISEIIEDEEFPIPPMMLFTFVENCFKHGSSKDPGVSWIHIKIIQQNTSLRFIAENSVPENKNRTIEKDKGVGLVNIRKRLELIYPGSYKLQVNDIKTSFAVQLLIGEEHEK